MFIENHDIPRFATVVKKDPGKLRVGAAINLLIGGIPSIYYGQEIGMLGNAQFGKYGKVITDANEIPSREAFEWYKEVNGKGMSFWYKGTGPWWDESNIKPNDGISFEEQEHGKHSLWNFYKSLLALRKKNYSLIKGDYVGFPNSNSQVLSFIRASENGHVLVVINLSEQAQRVLLNFSSANKKFTVDRLKNIFGGLEADKIKGNETALQLKDYDVQVFEI